MVDAALENPKVLFDPELELETVPELPGKEFVQGVVRKLAERQIRCPKIIRADHGWLFYISGEDLRRYVGYLTYIATKSGASMWVLTCKRAAGLRVWELFQPEGKVLGLEEKYLGLVKEILFAHYGFRDATWSGCAGPARG